MGSEWLQSTWGDEITLEYGKRLSGYKTAKGPIRVFGANGPVGWTSSPLVAGPGVILGRKGVNRGVEYSMDPFYVIDTAYYAKPKREMNMRWLYYAIQHHRLGDIDDGSPIPSTTRSAVYVRPLDVPPLSVQHRIADVLGKLDDKIELNRRMNRTLEKMAAAIFKSWFIDFDPVHQKAEGRDPNLPPEIADLFPDTFEDSVLGPIPKGWGVGALGEAVTLTGGGTPKKSTAEYWGGSIPWFSVVDAPAPSDVFVLDTRDHITEAGIAGSSTKLLPPGTTIISARGTVGKCALVAKPMAMNQSCYGVRGCHPGTDIFIYYLLQQHVGTLSRSGHGSVFNTITRATFDSIFTIVAPPSIASAFDENVKPFMGRILANNEQTQTLAGLRDTLLPKLLSGEIELPEIEAIVEEVAQ